MNETKAALMGQIINGVLSSSDMILSIVDESRMELVLDRAELIAESIMVRCIDGEHVEHIESIDTPE